MSGISKKLMGTTAAGGGFTAIEDVFSTYLYTGNGSTQTITNGIDLAGEGGLVWLKSRNFGYSHFLFDTVRGASSTLSISTGAAFTTSRISSFNVDGFTLGVDEFSNNAAYNYASWTFRKAPRFFDVVTYTGNGTTQAINHNLGSVPGVIITKRTDSADDWTVYHRSEGATRYGFLHLTNAFATSSTRWNDTEPTDTQFFLGNDGATNGSGGSFVAYLFAHDPLGPSGDGSDGLIACGSAPNNARTELGWEPQWVLFKASAAATNWYIVDNMRGLTANLGDDRQLWANSSAAETAPSGFIKIDSTGFTLANISASPFIYIAIRRGPMRVPESGTEVFATRRWSISGGADSTPMGVPVIDSMWWKPTDVSVGWAQASRLTDDRYLSSNSTSAETTNTSIGFDGDNYGSATPPSQLMYLTSLTGTNDNQALYAFRRAPEFFDVVAYTPSSPTPVKHNLGVPYELKIDKVRDQVSNWNVVWDDGVTQLEGELNNTATLNSQPRVANTSTEFVSSFNGAPCVSYLFATLAGVSKVGSYTGNGSSQTIDCGFTTGARLVLIKATSTTGDWLIADTARGIVAGNDPYLELNTTNAEVTSEDWLDPDSSGFVVNEVSGSNANTSGVSYIFYAVA